MVGEDVEKGFVILQIRSILLQRQQLEYSVNIALLLRFSQIFEVQREVVQRPVYDKPP